VAEPARKLAVSLVPREHGAWALLLQPFLAALIVLHKFAWPMLPALAAVVLVFLVRDPLTVLARQEWVWRDRRLESALALRYLTVEIALLALAGVALALVWPLWILAVLAGAAAALTLLAVYMTVRNRQRLQALSAAGLSSSALAACLAVLRTVPVWGWWMWGLHAAHFLGGILVVHTRLEARIAAKKSTPVLTEAFQRMRNEATAVQAVLVFGAVALAATGRLFYAAALAGSGAFHLMDLYNLHTERALAMPLRSVGKRALTVSIAFSLLIVAGSF